MGQTGRSEQTRNPHKKLLNIKHNLVAQNQFQNQPLHEKFIKL